MSQVKDRLLELQQRQNNELTIQVDSQNDGKRQKGKKSKSVEEKTDQFLERITQVRTLIAKIEENLLKIVEFEGAACNDAFNLSDIFKRINGTFKENADIAYKITNSLKELNQEVKKIKHEQTAAARMKIIQFTTTKDKFSEVLQRNSDLLERHKNIEKDNLKAQIRVADSNYDEDKMEEFLEDPNNPFQVFTDNYLMSTEEAKLQLRDIEERHKALLQIEERLVEVRELFRQIAILVDMQQESINRIEYHAGAATEYIDAVDLNEVRKSKNRYLKRKCYLLLALVIIILLIIIAIIR